MELSLPPPDESARPMYVINGGGGTCKPSQVLLTEAHEITGPGPMGWLYNELPLQQTYDLRADYMLWLKFRVCDASGNIINIPRNSTVIYPVRIFLRREFDIVNEQEVVTTGQDMFNLPNYTFSPLDWGAKAGETWYIRCSWAGSNDATAWCMSEYTVVVHIKSTPSQRVTELLLERTCHYRDFLNTVCNSGMINMEQDETASIQVRLREKLTGTVLLETVELHVKQGATGTWSKKASGQGTFTNPSLSLSFDPTQVIGGITVEPTPGTVYYMKAVYPGSSDHDPCETAEVQVNIVGKTACKLVQTSPSGTTLQTRWDTPMDFIYQLQDLSSGAGIIGKKISFMVKKGLTGTPMEVTTGTTTSMPVAGVKFTFNPSNLGAKPSEVWYAYAKWAGDASYEAAESASAKITILGECTSGQKQTQACPDGSVITTHNCVNGIWEPTGVQCGDLDPCALFNITDGMLVAEGVGKAVYLIENGKKRYMTTAVMQSCGYSTTVVLYIGAECLAKIPFGADLPACDPCASFTIPDGALIAEAPGKAVYLYGGIPGAPLKKRYMTTEVMLSCGYNISDVIYVGKVCLDSIVTGDPIKPCEPRVCDEGAYSEAEQCEDGTTVYHKVCQSNQWVDTGESCPETQEPTVPFPTLAAIGIGIAGVIGGGLLLRRRK